MNKKSKRFGQQIQLFLSSSAVLISMQFDSVQVYAQRPSAPYHRTPGCVDGACYPNRSTNGYYPTVWRQWPGNNATDNEQFTPNVPRGIKGNTEVPPPEKELDLPIHQAAPQAESSVSPESRQPSAPTQGKVVPDNLDPQMRQYLPQPPQQEKPLPAGVLPSNSYNFSPPQNNIQPAASLTIDQPKASANLLAIPTQNMQSNVKPDNAQPATRLMSQPAWQPSTPTVKKVTSEYQSRVQMPDASPRAGSISQIMIHENNNLTSRTELKITPESLESEMQNQVKLHDAKSAQINQNSVRNVLNLREPTLASNPSLRAGSINNTVTMQTSPKREPSQVVQTSYVEQIPATTSATPETQSSNDAIKQNTSNWTNQTTSAPVSTLNQTQSLRSGSITTRGVSQSNPLR